MRIKKASYPSLITTHVKESIGYQDPEYYQCHKLTEKSDIYSLGVVFLEVLSARLAISQGEDEEHASLAEWATLCLKNDNIEQIVAPNLEGSIAKGCLDVHVEIAMKCLAERGVDRPSIGEVLENLVLAMHLQENGGTSQDGNVHRNDNIGMQGYSDLTPGVKFSKIMMPIGR